MKVTSTEETAQYDVGVVGHWSIIKCGPPLPDENDF